VKTTTKFLISLLLLLVGMCNDCVAHVEAAHDVCLKLYNTYLGSSEIRSSHKDTYNRSYQTFSQKLSESLDD
jgi:hypothetical protein